VFLGQHRDSDAMDRSNFTVALAELGGESDTVLVIRENHWAVGWVEWIGIHESDTAAQAKAESMLARIENYPLLDEQHHSELEWRESAEWWERMRVCERLELCQRFGLSIFAARHADLPQDDSNELYEYLRGN
jgi:hypothetical protein